MKNILSIIIGLLILCLAGCDQVAPEPRFAGTIISHIETYGSGTGTSSQLSSAGQMQTGFDYADDSRMDWTADIKWSFIRREDESDVYHIEWEFQAQNGSPVFNDAELSFDGLSPAKLTITEQLIISIEPTF